MLKVSVDNSVVIAELLKNNVVVRTPHIGNYNLGHMWCIMTPQKVFPKEVADSIIPVLMLNFDRNNGQKDNNFHPWKIIDGGMSRECFCANKLSYAYEDDIHIRQLRKVFPNARMMSFTTYLRKWTRRADRDGGKSVMLQILKLVSKDNLRIWYRKSCQDGYIRRVEPISWQHIVDDGILGINGAKSGWLLPNILNVLLSIICEAQLTGRDIIYHLSGPDMYKYIKTMVDDLRKMYDMVVEANLLPRLPKSLHFVVVSVSNLRLVCLRKNRVALNRIVELYLANKSDVAARGKLFAVAQKVQNKEELRKLSVEAKQVETEFLQNLRSEVVKVPEMFFNIYEANYLTQHDLTFEDELYVHPWMLMTPVGEVDKFYKFLFNLYKKSTIK